MDSPWFIPLLTVMGLCAVTSGVSFVRGQRVLNDLRDRFPVQYDAAGQPSYFVLAAWGKGYWRPVSAANFFRLRRYDLIPDRRFVRRADVVRRWQRVARYATWVMLGLIVVIEYQRR